MDHSKQLAARIQVQMQWFQMQRNVVSGMQAQIAALSTANAFVFVHSDQYLQVFQIQMNAMSEMQAQFAALIIQY